MKVVFTVKVIKGVWTIRRPRASLAERASALADRQINQGVSTIGRYLASDFTNRARLNFSYFSHSPLRVLRIMPFKVALL